MTGYSKSENWFEMWESDKNSIIDTMVRNMQSDLDCGYNPDGACITRQKKVIEEERQSINDAFDRFVNMTDEQVNRWCFFDLKKRGAID